MSKSEKEKFIEFCGVLGFKVNDTQMKVFELYNQAKQENKEMFINLGRQQGRQYLNTILINFELWEKDHRIAELEKENDELKEQLKGAIVPKFKVGQKVKAVLQNGISGGVVEDLTIESIIIADEILYDTEIGCISERDIFATEQEAREKLEDMKNEANKN